MNSELAVNCAKRAFSVLPAIDFGVGEYRRMLAEAAAEIDVEIAHVRRDSLVAKLLSGWLAEHTGEDSESVLRRARDVVARELDFDASQPQSSEQ